MNNMFPFPSYDLARFEIENSFLSKKIIKIELEKYLNKSWNIGKNEAIILMNSNTEISFVQILKEKKIQLINLDIDNIIGNKRYYADFISKDKRIYLYLKSIDLWAKNNNIEFTKAYNMTLAHEYFHYLEITKIGILSDSTNIPFIKIFNKSIGKSRFLVLSEIGAYAFVNTLFKEGKI